MHNFEARYRAIVEKDDRLVYQDLYEGRLSKWRDADTGQSVSTSIARRAIRSWLEETLPEGWLIRMEREGVWEIHQGFACCIGRFTDPADAIMTAWEIILGIKEKP